MQEINSRFAYVENVVNYCEAAYPTGDKAAVAEQAEGYLTDALQAVRARLCLQRRSAIIAHHPYHHHNLTCTSHAQTQIAGDIEVNAKNLVDVLSLQSEELGVVASRLEHIKFQLQLVKETHATVELNKMRAPVRSSGVDWTDLSEEELQEATSGSGAAGKRRAGPRFGDRPVVEMLDKPVVKRQAWSRMPIAVRFAM